MSIYQNQGASCITCLWQEDALMGNITAKYHCKACGKKDGRPGWDPKPNIRIQYISGVSQNNKNIIIRKVVTS